MAGAAFGSCLKGWDVVARAARGSRNRGRRSTLEMPLPKSWQAQHSVLADCVKVLRVRVFACLGFGIIRCSADASVAYLTKHRLVGLSGPFILVIFPIN